MTAAKETYAPTENLAIASLQVPGYPAPDVPPCPRADDSAFEGAVLIGDSIAEPFNLHSGMPPFLALSVTGLSARTAIRDNLFPLDGKLVQLETKLLALQPRIVYLWIGNNGIDRKDAALVLEEYNLLLNQLIRALPDTLFYLISLTPVKAKAQERFPNFTNEQVNAFNEGLYALAKEHNVYYLPINPLLRNERGTLDDVYGAGDGIHLRAAAYEVLSNFFYTHMIPLTGN